MNPIISQKPIIGKDPIISRHPIIGEKPVIAQQPIISRQPIVAEKPIISKAQAAKRAIRNAAKTISHIAPLKQVLFNKINRHESKAPIIGKSNPGDFSDARYYERFAGHSTHYSSRNFI